MRSEFQAPLMHDDEASETNEDGGETILLTAGPGYQRTRSTELPSSTMHVLFGRRWFMLLLFMMLAGSNQLQWITFGPISSVCQEFYDISPFQVNMLSMIFMLVYLPGSFLGARYIDVRGEREALVLAAFFNALGSGVRTIGSRADHRSYEMVVIGQVIVSLTQCVVFAMPSKLAAVWFGAEEQGMSVALGWVGTYFGTAIGFFVPPLAVSAENAGTSLPRLMLTYTLVNAVVFVLVVAFYQSAPPSPPSALADHHGDKSHDDEDKTVWSLMSNRPFMKLCAGFTTFIGITYAFGTVIEDLWSFELTSNEIGQLGLLQVLSGTAGVFLMGPLLDWTHAYHKLNIILATLATISLLGMAIAAHLSIKWLTFAASMLFGFAATGMNSTAMEYAMGTWSALLQLKCVNCSI
jgi:FLVCR family feline leukemia virus subgroup C receptor-related protein